VVDGRAGGVSVTSLDHEGEDQVLVFFFFFFFFLIWTQFCNLPSTS